MFAGMKLTPAQADRFFAAWFPLLGYVNEVRRIVPRTTSASTALTIREALPLRDALWADDSLLDAFVAENPAGLSADLLDAVARWKHRVAGTFVAWKHYKKHTIFLRDSDAYAVLGLRSGLEEIFPRPLPILLDAVLLPFEGVIVTDGLLTTKNVILGPGMRRGMKEAYDRAVERGAVWTSLPSDASGATRTDPTITNRKVLSSFRSYLSGQRRLKPATVERDLLEIKSFAERLGDGRSLLEWSLEDVEAIVAAAATLFGGRAQTVAALKRFVAFMRETERTHPAPAEEALEWLRMYGGR
jgi:hypothetical protein